MEDKEEYIRLFEERERKIESWLDGIQTVISSVYVAQENLEFTRLQKSIITNIPTEYFPQVRLPSISDVNATNLYFEKQYPSNPILELPTGGTVTITSGSSIDIVGAISQSSIDLSPWIGNDLKAYEEHQQKSLRLENVYQALRSIDLFLGDEFNTSKELYYNLSLGISKKSSVGIAMRNVIEHLKGVVFNKVQKPRGKVKWSEMVFAQCLYPKGSKEFDTLLGLEKTNDELHSILTNFAKNIPTKINQTIDSTWVRYLDFLFAFTGLIRIT